MKKFLFSSSHLHYRLSFLFLTLGLYILFFSPLLGRISTHTTSANDGSLIIWLIQQSAYFWTGQGSLYHWPIFHPYLYTATYSDPFLTLGLIQVPLQFITDNVIAQLNILLLLSSVASFISMYLLAKTIWKTTLTAWITSVAFSFSFLYLQFSVHLHTFFIAGLPLSLWGLIQYFQTKKLRYLFALAGAFLLQAYNAPMTAYFIVGVLLVYVISEKKLVSVLKDRYFVYAALLVLASCLWLYTPYLLTAEKFDAARTIKDAAHFSFPLSRLLWVDVLFPAGLLFLSFFLKRKHSANAVILARTCFLIALLGAVCMMGPVAKFGDHTIKIFSIPIPLPYAVMYYIVPGISAFRAVTRWAVVLNFGLSLSLGWLLHNYSIKLRVLIALLAIWLVSMGLLYQQYVPLQFVSTTLSPIYATVKNQPEKVLAEMPITQWDMAPFDSLEYSRLLYQLKHHKALYNGVSGFMPQARSAEIHTHYEHFPDDTSLDILLRNGVDLVVIHLDEYQRMEDDKFRYGEYESTPLSQLITDITNQPRLELVECTNTPVDCLYRLK